MTSGPCYPVFVALKTEYMSAVKPGFYFPEKGVLRVEKFDPMGLSRDEVTIEMSIHSRLVVGWFARPV